MLTSWWTGSPQQFNINEIIYSVSPVHPGSWKDIPLGFQVVADVRICPNGQLRRFGLNFNEITNCKYPVTPGSLRVLSPTWCCVSTLVLSHLHVLVPWEKSLSKNASVQPPNTTNTLTQTIRIETMTALTSLYVSLYVETTTAFCSSNISLYIETMTASHSKR